MIQRISSCLAHSDLEQLYFVKLVELEKARRKGRDTEAIRARLREMNPRVDRPVEIPLSQFSLISQWYFYAIKQLVDTASFKEDCAFIRRRLRKKVSMVEIRTAMRVLRELGLVEKEPAGRLRTTRKSVCTSSDVSSAGLKEHHRQMAMRGIEALDEQEMVNREFNALTLRVSPASLPKIKEALRHFVVQFDKRFEDLASENVFQLNIQFFEHTGERKEGPQ
jgi:uncharacterized protein (TIGR02147 family)